LFYLFVPGLPGGDEGLLFELVFAFVLVGVVYDVDGA
jgi:hypothetical protein